MTTSFLIKPTALLAVSSCLFLASCTKSELGSCKDGSITSSFTTTGFFTKDADFTNVVTDSGTSVVHYRPGPENGQDVYTDFYGGSQSGNQNHVPELPVNVWNYAGGIKTRSFLRFPKLTSFPDSLKIVSARLYLYPPKDFLNHPQGNTGANECVIQRVLRGWTEDGLTWANQPRDVTEEDEAFIPETTDQWNYAPVIDITVMVKKMVSGEVPNHGFRITLVNEKPNAAVNFASSESVDNWRRPMLEIEYK